MPDTKPATVVPLFKRSHGRNVAAEVIVGRPLTTPAPAGPGQPAAIDLAGRIKVLMVIGRGNVGKTTLLRWIVETMLAKESDASIAAVDPENRSLKDYFEAVHEPDSYVPAAVLQWLEEFLRFLMEHRASAAVDFGGGDTSLAQLVAAHPDLVGTLEAEGVTPVAIHVVGPRVDDLSPLATFEQAGFRPRATAIVLNQGAADPTLPREEAFAWVLRHTAYRTAVDRGVVPLWMPRLIPANEIEVRRILFAQARDGQAPEGREVVPLGPFDRARVRHWLDAMAREFQPIASWIP